MKILAGKQNFKCLFATLVLIAFAFIFVQSELIAEHVHRDNDINQDYCKLVSQTIQRAQEDFQKFDTVINFQPIQKDPIIFYKNPTCFNSPINLIQENTPLILMLETFLI
jgi:hypothetical protein